MKELFEQLPHVEMSSANPSLLLDSCFIISMLEAQQEKELLKHDCAVISFTAEEVTFVEHRIHDKSKVRLRHLLKHDHKLKVIDVPVSPGSRAAEERFVASIDPKLLELIPDPSDAVLIAAALKTRSNVLTKDRHHLYTSVLENYLEDKPIAVYKNFKDMA